MAKTKSDAERLLKIETDQDYIRQQLDQLREEQRAFIDHIRATRKEDHFNKKDVIQIVGGAIATSAILFAGFVYLVDTRVSPIKQDQSAMLVQTNNRFDTFQESIKSLREFSVNQAKNVETTNVELAAQQKTIATLEALHLEGLNAKQDQEIADLDRRMTSIDHLASSPPNR